ncbi:hypothetical protein FOMPIDRAFT_1017044 [Fomitopsis schrenkii]|uniref:Uncharacterized protein n=1 Tax=Fomitopsis schrenkii TaxID=2126942 RepID=S8E2Z3_FOMSC|nr:hypothetical protein FOMPIDRAFT_1017044 [Fomitopsis schrenkii]
MEAGYMRAAARRRRAGGGQGDSRDACRRDRVTLGAGEVTGIRYRGGTEDMTRHGAYAMGEPPTEGFPAGVASSPEDPRCVRLRGHAAASPHALRPSSTRACPLEIVQRSLPSLVNVLDLLLSSSRSLAEADRRARSPTAPFLARRPSSSPAPLQYSDPAMSPPPVLAGTLPPRCPTNCLDWHIALPLRTHTHLSLSRISFFCWDSLIISRGAASLIPSRSSPAISGALLPCANLALTRNPQIAPYCERGPFVPIRFAVPQIAAIHTGLSSLRASVRRGVGLLSAVECRLRALSAPTEGHPRGSRTAHRFHRRGPAFLERATSLGPAARRSTAAGRTPGTREWRGVSRARVPRRDPLHMHGPGPSRRAARSIMRSPERECERAAHLVNWPSPRICTDVSEYIHVRPHVYSLLCIATTNNGVHTLSLPPISSLKPPTPASDAPPQVARAANDLLPRTVLRGLAPPLPAPPPPRRACELVGTVLGRGGDLYAAGALYAGWYLRCGSRERMDLHERLRQVATDGKLHACILSLSRSCGGRTHNGGTSVPPPRHLLRGARTTITGRSAWSRPHGSARSVWTRTTSRPPSPGRRVSACGLPPVAAAVCATRSGEGTEERDAQGGRQSGSNVCARPTRRDDWRGTYVRRCVTLDAVWSRPVRLVRVVYRPRYYVPVVGEPPRKRSLMQAKYMLFLFVCQWYYSISVGLKLRLERNGPEMNAWDGFFHSVGSLYQTRRGIHGEPLQCLLVSAVSIFVPGGYRAPTLVRPAILIANPTSATSHSLCIASEQGMFVANLDGPFPPRGARLQPLAGGRLHICAEIQVLGLHLAPVCERLWLIRIDVEGFGIFHPGLALRHYRWTREGGSVGPTSLCAVNLWVLLATGPRLLAGRYSASGRLCRGCVGRGCKKWADGPH